MDGRNVSIKAKQRRLKEFFTRFNQHRKQQNGRESHVDSL